MKDRALRRHQDFKAKIKKQHDYERCASNLPLEEREALKDNIEKLKKVCVYSHYEDHSGKTAKKTIQERRHDITMNEQLQA